MNPYIQSLRLRTLPLSMSGIILGSGLAGWRHLPVFALAICTTLSLQILSNLSNELGDAQKGTDADQHGRDAYGLQSGKITEKQIKTMIGGGATSKEFADQIGADGWSYDAVEASKVASAFLGI